MNNLTSPYNLPFLAELKAQQQRVK